MALAAQRSLPTPPTPVMPPEGVAPVTQTQDATGEDLLSPTTIVLNYLKARGFQPTTENVRRALEANARDRGTIPGLDERSSPGLINDIAGVDPVQAPQRRAAPRRQGGTPDTPPDRTQTTSAPPTPDVDTRPVLPRVGAPPPDMGPGPLPNQLPPPIAPAPVGVPPVPQISPPPAGAQAAIPPPPNPMEAAMSRAVPQLPPPPTQLALPAPEGAPALPAPPVRPMIAGPPPIPQIEAPPTRLGLPAPEPGLGNLTGPQGEPGGRVRVGTVTPKAPPISPQNPVVQTPLSRGIGRVVPGAIVGGARGGIPGAIAGGLGALGPEAKDLAAYIAKNLHLY